MQWVENWDSAMTSRDAVQSVRNPVYSDYAGDPEFAELLRTFFKALPTLSRELQALVAARRIDDLRMHAHHLKGTGGGYGFPQLTAAATALEAACDIDDFNRIEAAVQSIAQLLMRIRI